MSRVDEHVVHVDTERGSGWSRWVCTCGRRSKLFAFPGHAEIAGRAHVRALGVHRR